ncbi:MAG: acyltransferase [Proteobacteria bacterium]|nr:acyltransferase [Pseudomonadota bacterium]
MAIDNLRSFLTVLVVAHHAVLAYVSYAPLPFAGWGEEPMAWRAFPVVDTVRAPALDLLVGFNDAFFMSLFFLVAGLFTWRGLVAKGAIGYLKRRVLRLGVPFALSAAVLAQVAYYPAYLQHGGQPGLWSYLGAWLSLDAWPAGPAWFLWVLLALSGLAALVYRVAPGWGSRLGERLRWAGDRPGALFGLLLAISAAIYMPVTMLVAPQSWFELGPFSVQTSRALHYALYFVFGVGLGGWALEGDGGTGRAGLFSSEGKLARGWPLWTGLAVISFVALVACAMAFFGSLKSGTPNETLRRAANFGFTLSCAASSFMCLSVFLRFGDRTGSLWRSFGRNAFGIYVVHYVFASWTQFALLDRPLSAGTKATLVFLAALLLSWGATIALRKIPGVAVVVGGRGLHSAEPK